MQLVYVMPLISIEILVILRFVGALEHHQLPSYLYRARISKAPV